MVSNFQINTCDPNVMYLNHLVTSNKDLFQLMRKSARKADAGILVYHRDYSLFKCQWLLSLQTFSVIQRNLCGDLDLSKKIDLIKIFDHKVSIFDPIRSYLKRSIFNKIAHDRSQNFFLPVHFSANEFWFWHCFFIMLGVLRESLQE